MNSFIDNILNDYESDGILKRTDNTDSILEVKDLKMHFPVYKGVFRRVVAHVKAVDGVSFSLKHGETLGLVGESGCGKSTVGRTLIRLYEPTSGEILLHDESLLSQNNEVQPYSLNLSGLSRKEMRPYRAEMQMIFQDPYSSLNPRLTVGAIVEEPMRVHPHKVEGKFLDKVVWLLEKVGLSAEQAFRYPHEFSGGQRQRIGIARALSTNPRIIIADEPVSALDVSVQAQVINLMQDLQEEFGLTYIFIAHDLSVVKHISDRIAVMYLGNIVEIGPADKVYNESLHPYSKALIAAVPIPDPTIKKEKITVSGDVPSPLSKPSGCAFRTRCPIADSICAEKQPELVEISPDHFAACHFVKK